MNGWRDCTLGELVHVKHGFAFLGEHFAETGTHVVLTPGNFLEKGGFRSKGDKEKWYRGPIPEEFVLRRGDVLVAMTEQAEGLLGSAATVPADDLYLHNQRLGLLQLLAPARADLAFVYHLFNTPHVRQQIRATASGVKVRHTAPSRIAAVKVRVPGLAEQRSIAGILSAYDALIENCERRIRVLDDIARALYRGSFAAAATYDARRLGDIALVLRGRSYRSSELAEEGGIPFVNLKCVARDGGFRRDGVKRFVGEPTDAHAVRRGDVVIALTDMTQERRIVARAARVPLFADAEFALFSMDLAKIVPRDGIEAVWLYCYLRYSSFADHLKQHANGANVLHLAADRLKEHVLALPPREQRSTFARVCSGLFDLSDALELRSDNLRKTRDLLLPRLLSGQLSPKDAEAAA